MKLVFTQIDGSEETLSKSEDVLWLKLLAAEIHGEGEMINWQFGAYGSDTGAGSDGLYALFGDGSYFSILTGS